MSTRTALSFAVTALILAACGTGTPDRALSGGPIGAGVGGAAGVLGGAPVTDAPLGGAVGAGVGTLTNPNQIDLGKPAWQ